MTFKYNKGDIVYIIGNGDLNKASIEGVTLLANKEGIFYQYYIKTSYDDAVKKREDEIFDTKLDCVKAFLGVEGDFDEAMI